MSDFSPTNPVGKTITAMHGGQQVRRPGTPATEAATSMYVYSI
jgi:hypothetical protein